MGELRHREERAGDDSPYAACTVHCAGVHRIINLQSDHRLGSGAVHAAAHSADDDSSPRHNCRTAGSDGDKSSQNPCEVMAEVLRDAIK